MRKQVLMTAKKPFALTLAALHAQSNDEPATDQIIFQDGILDVLDRIRQTQAQQCEGSWVVTVTPGRATRRAATALLPRLCDGLTRRRFYWLSPHPALSQTTRRVGAYRRQ